MLLSMKLLSDAITMDCFPQLPTGYKKVSAKYIFDVDYEQVWLGSTYSKYALGVMFDSGSRTMTSQLLIQKQNKRNS